MKRRAKRTPSYTELLDAAMTVTDQVEANKLLAKMILICHRQSQKSLAECEKIQRENLGYYAGYYDNKTRERVERLFKCAHPVFGAIAKVGPVTPEQAFKMGMEAGKRARARR